MDGGEAVRVVVQARPLLPGEESAAVSVAPPHTVRLARHAPAAHATGSAGLTAPVDEFGPYDAVCAPGVKTAEELYGDHVSALVGSLFDGINGTVMAYGQTASGKTYTMTGLGGLVAEDVFGRVAVKSKEKNVVVRVSFVEIYQESIRDLIDALPVSRQAAVRSRGKPGGGASTGVVNVTVRTRRNGTVFLDGAKEVPVRNAPQLLALVEAGARIRQTAATGMNATSSRSHSIVTITVEQEPFDGGGRAGGSSGAASPGFLSAKLHLVDLAGSERTKRCTTAGGTRFAEGVSINSGLLALAKVISALADNSAHVPYRESKLTRLLQDSLGGNSRSLVFACVSPAASSREETANTLRYAMRIKNIRNKPRVNVDPAAVENSDLRAALARARAQIAALTTENDRLRKLTPARLLRSPAPPLSKAGPNSALAASSPTSSPSPPVANFDFHQEQVPRLRLQPGREVPNVRKEAAVAASSSAVPPASNSPTWEPSVQNVRQAASPTGRRTSPSSSGANVRRTVSDSSVISPSKPPLSSEERASRRAHSKPVPGRPFGPASAKKPPGEAAAHRGVVQPYTPERSPRTGPVRRSFSEDDLPEAPVTPSADIEPGSLMVRLAELESLLHDSTPIRPRSDKSTSSRATSKETSPVHVDIVSSSFSPFPPPEVDVVALESAAARRGLSSLIEPDPLSVNAMEQHVSSDGKLHSLTTADVEAKIRSAYQHRMASVEKGRAEALLEVDALNAKLAATERVRAADLKTLDAEHQACIAELRSSLTELQKKESERKRRLGDPSEQDRHRLLRRLAALKAANEEAQEKLAEALGKSGESKSATSNLLREKRNLIKSEKSLKVRVQRLEAIRAKQQETIADLTERERLASIERHRKRHNKDRDAPKTDSSPSSVSTGSSTLTARQRQQFVERELLTIIQRQDGSFAKDDAQMHARHWAWIRSMDDAKAILRMCIVQLVEARAERSPAMICTTEGRIAAPSQPGLGIDSGNELRPSRGNRAQRRSSLGCGKARISSSSSSLPRSSSITLRCSPSTVSSHHGR